MKKGMGEGELKPNRTVFPMRPSSKIEDQGLKKDFWDHALCICRIGLFGVVGVTGLLFLACNGPTTPPAPPSTPAVKPNDSENAEASEEQVRSFCTACHAFPPPETFPRSAWRFEVVQAYGFYEHSNYDNAKLRNLRNVPPAASVIKYFENRAPHELTRLPAEPSLGNLRVQFERHDVANSSRESPAIANVNLVHLYDDKKLDLLVCDMRSGEVLVLKPYEKDFSWKVLAKLSHPCHAEVVDLDGDGIKDLVVADLGSFSPSNDKVGKVVWLRGKPDGSFTPYTLLEGVGRVADVQAADFNGDGKMDLIVGVFGWRFIGEIIYLENRTVDWSKPQFTPHILDDRHGTIHVPVCDLNKDGKPDFVALISQEHETIVAFINEGDGRFRKETIYTASHPAYGSSGIQLIDMDGDGDLDVLYINGDILDEPFVLKPYHGVQWLKNKGKFPFEHHPIGPMYGAMAGVAADFTGKARRTLWWSATCRRNGFRNEGKSGPPRSCISSKPRQANLSAGLSRCSVAIMPPAPPAPGTATAKCTWSPATYSLVRSIPLLTL
jgi:hypothetical protein